MKFNFNKFIACITIILVIIFSIDFAISTEEFKHSKGNNKLNKRGKAIPPEIKPTKIPVVQKKSVIAPVTATLPLEEGKVLKTITDWRELFYEVARDGQHGDQFSGAFQRLSSENILKPVQT